MLNNLIPNVLIFPNTKSEVVITTFIIPNIFCFSYQLLIKVFIPVNQIVQESLKLFFKNKPDKI